MSSNSDLTATKSGETFVFKVLSSHDSLNDENSANFGNVRQDYYGNELASMHLEKHDTLMRNYTKYMYITSLLLFLDLL